MQARNPKYNGYGTVDCEIWTEKYGWVPFTANPNDSSEECRKIYAECANGKCGKIAKYTPPPPPTREEIEAEKEELRKAMIRNEVMPLFIEAQAGIKSDTLWRGKLVEIDQKISQMSDNEVIEPSI